MRIYKEDLLGFFNSYGLQETIEANSYISILKYSEYSENRYFQTLCSKITICIFFWKSI